MTKEILEAAMLAGVTMDDIIPLIVKRCKEIQSGKDNVASLNVAMCVSWLKKSKHPTALMAIGQIRN